MKPNNQPPNATPIKILDILETKFIPTQIEPSGIVSNIEYKCLLPNGMILRITNNNNYFYLTT